MKQGNRYYLDNTISISAITPIIRRRVNKHPFNPVLIEQPKGQEKQTHKQKQKT
jgi:hypothetical protein